MSRINQWYIQEYLGTLRYWDSIPLSRKGKPGSISGCPEFTSDITESVVLRKQGWPWYYTYMCVIHYIIVNISRTVHSQDFTSRKSLDTQRIRRLHTELCDAKITFFVVLILLSPITTISRYFRNFIPFFWYQRVPLTVAQHFHTFVLSWIH